MSAGTATAELGTPMALHSATREPAEADRDHSLALLIGVCSVAFLLRLAFTWYILPHYGAARIYGTGSEPIQIGTAIAQGRGFTSLYGVPSGPTAWLPPVYPLVVAATFRLFGVSSMQSLWCLCIANIVCATLTTALIYRIGVRCFGPIVGFAASLLWAVDIGYIAYSVRIWESSLSALLATLAVLFYLHLRESPARRRDWVFYGLFWAFAALTNTVLLTLMPLSVIFLLYRKGRELRRYALAALVAFACALLPWCIRNYVVFHKVIPIRSNFGPNLWYGNHPGVQGPADEFLDPPHNPRELQSYLAMGDAAYCSSRQKMAFDFIRQNPAEFAHLTWARVVFFWTGAALTERLLPTCWLLLAVLAVLLMVRRHAVPEAVPFASALLFFPLPYYVTHAESFYRHPIEPVMGLLVAYACVALLDAGRHVVKAKSIANRSEQ